MQFQEATVRTGHGTTDWFQIGKEDIKAVYLSAYLFILYAKYIVQNAGLDESQAGIKTAGRNISNLRYADRYHPNGRKQRGTKEPLDKSERVKRVKKVGLKLNIQKTKTMVSGRITSW